MPIPGDVTLSVDSEHADRTANGDDSYLSAAQADGSFMFAKNLPSSTPNAKNGETRHEAWEDSLESPFDQMDRKLRDELRLDGAYESSDMPTPSLPSGYSMPRLDGASTRTVDPADLPRARGEAGPTGTPKAKPRSRLSNGSSRNPFDGAPNGSWNGIADLRSTPLNAKFAKGKAKKFDDGPRPSTLATAMADLTEDMDDDEPMAMSPPVTMNFSLPPRAAAVLNTGKTPVKKEKRQSQARMIIDDLMEEMAEGMSPRMPTPEGLGRYSMLPMDMSGGKRLFDTTAPSGIDLHGSVLEDLTGDGPTSAPAPTRRSMANTSFGSDGPGSINIAQKIIYSNDDTFDADDSFDSEPGVPHATLSHHSGSYVVDTGDVSGFSDADASLAREVFNPAAQAGNRAGFALMKPEEMHTYHGGRLEDAAGREVMDSPTYAKR